MAQIGIVSSLWRYPVKSMAGEEMNEVFVGYAGFYGDRVFAFTSKGAPNIFPYHTARANPDMLRYRPRFKPSIGVAPDNWAAIDEAGLPVTPVEGVISANRIFVETPSGDCLALDSAELKAELGPGEELTLLQSDRVIADCSPVSLLSKQTVNQLGMELDIALDPRRFRANIYVDFLSGEGFEEDRLVGKTIMIGDKTMIAIMERDPRCAMIALDPDTGERNKEILRHVSKQHDNMTGVYGVVLSEGIIRSGDEIKLLT